MYTWILTLIIAGVVLYSAHADRFIYDGEIGPIGFETLQLLYTAIVIVYIIQNYNNSAWYGYSSVLGIILAIAIIHLIRAISKINIIWNINKPIVNIAASIFILILILNIQLTMPIAVLLGVGYFILAKSSFDNYYNRSRPTTRLYYDIPMTIGLIMVLGGYVYGTINLPMKILPLVIGNTMYHLYELIDYNCYYVYTRNFNLR